MAPTEAAAKGATPSPRSRTTASAGTGAGSASSSSSAKDLAKVLNFKETLDKVATASAGDLRAALDGLRALGPPDVNLLKTSSVGRSLNHVAKVASDAAIRENARELVEEWKQACRKRKHEEDASGNKSAQTKVANVASTRPSQAKQQQQQQQTGPKQQCLVIGSSGSLVQTGADSADNMSWEAWAMAAREFIVRLPGDPPVPELSVKEHKHESSPGKEQAHKFPLSPETQEAHKFPLSPEPQEAQNFPLSPETQEAQKFPLSPDARVLFSPDPQFPLSPDTRVMFSPDPQFPLSPETRVMFSPEPQEAPNCPLSPESHEAHGFLLSPDLQVVLSLEPQEAQKDESSPEKQEAHTFVSSPGKSGAHKSEPSPEKEEAHNHMSSPGEQKTHKNEPSSEKQEAQPRE